MAAGIYGGNCVTNHTAMVFDRGGTRRVGPLIDLSKVQWERARDNVGEGMVRIEGAACDAQSGFLSSLRSHRHELVIFRGADRVWEGPIHRIGSYPGFTEIYARDVSEYLFHTPMTQRYDNTAAGSGATTVTGRIGNIIDYELTHGRIMKVWDPVTETWNDHPVSAWEDLDPPINVNPHVVVHHWPNEARTVAVTIPFEMTVGEHLQNLARQSGIDFTTVGRSIHIWDVSRSLGRIQDLTEADFFSDIIVTEYGSDHTQASYVVSQDGIYGQSLNTDYLDYYGPWTDITTAYNEEGTVAPTQPELNSQASRNTAGRSPVPIEVRVPDNSGIILTDTLTINQLVPGVVTMLRAKFNSRQLEQMQKIDHVRVTETGSEENIQVTLTPTTRQDSDEEV